MLLVRLEFLMVEQTANRKSLLKKIQSNFCEGRGH